MWQTEALLAIGTWLILLGVVLVGITLMGCRLSESQRRDQRVRDAKREIDIIAERTVAAIVAEAWRRGSEGTPEPELHRPGSSVVNRCNSQPFVVEGELVEPDNPWASEWSK